MRIDDRVQDHHGDVTVHHRHAPLRASACPFLELVEKALSNQIALVVLVNTCPSHERIPHHRVDPRVLECGACETWRVPTEFSQRGIDEHHAEPESGMHDRVRLGVIECSYCLADVLRGLRDGRFCDDSYAAASAYSAEVG